MPAPLLMARKSGLYCRVFVPADLRPLLGQRYLVRALGARDRDEARLIAARYALVVGELFRKLRREVLMAEPKVDDVIKALQSGSARELISVSNTHTAAGDDILTISMENDEDARIAKERFGLSFANVGSHPIQAAPYRFLSEHSTEISKRLSEFQQHLTDANLSSKYLGDFEHSVGILISISGNLPPDDYTPDIIDEFVKRLKFLPSNPEKNRQHRDRWAKLSYLQLVNEVELMGMEPIHPTTVKKHITRLSTFFDFCRKRRYMNGLNPMTGRAPNDIARTKGKSKVVKPMRTTFDLDDFDRIFDPVRYRSRKLPHTFWPPLIALMTGARVNEIAQLYVDDIVDDDQKNPGRWRFMILAKEVDQRVKNKPSLRSIPMHPRLIELGFLEYLADLRRLGYKRVFPTLRYTEAAGYGDTVSDYFSGYLREKVGIIDAQKVFHSFRYYFCSCLFNESDQERMHIVGMTGHERDGVFESTHCGELHYENKMNILMKLILPDLKIPAYQAGTFDKYFVSAERNRKDAQERATKVPEPIGKTAA